MRFFQPQASALSPSDREILFFLTLYIIDLVFLYCVVSHFCMKNNSRDEREERRQNVRQNL